MLDNYFGAAIRDLFRNRAYTVINVCGLAIGFAAAILIALYVRDEYSYDRLWPNYDRIYKLDETVTLPGRPPILGSQTVSDIARALKLEFPQIDMTVRIVRAPVVLRRGDVKASVAGADWVDPDFFRMFSMKAIAGDADKALRQPDGIVLTRKIARRFFNRDDIVGETIELDREHVMRVAAVIEDLPSNTHLAGEVFLPAIASFSEMSRLDSIPWNSGQTKSFSVYTYVRLRRGASVETINSAMGGFAQRHLPGNEAGIPLAQVVKMRLSSVTDAHLGPRQGDAMKPQGDPRTLHALIGITSLILFISASNFVSMMTGRAQRRSVEVGVRKAVGATRGQIIVQFMGECLLYVVLALGVAIVAVDLFMPRFNGFLGHNIQFSYIRDPLLGAGILGIATIVGLAAAAYPSLVLATFRPSQVLRGNFPLAGGPGRLRELLVVIQFAALVALVIATQTIERQSQYAIQDRLRLPDDEIYISNSGCPRSFADALGQLAGVDAISCTSSFALAQSHFGAAFSTPTGPPVSTESAMIDYTYFRLFGIKPIAGRLLSSDHGDDDVLRSGDGIALNPSIIINESAVRALGFKSPQAAVGQYRRWSRPAIVGGNFRMTDSMRSKIVGVVPDFSVGSIRDLIAPTAYYVDPLFSSYATVLKLSDHRMPETLRGVKELWTQHGAPVPFEGMFLSQYFNDLYSDILRQTTIFSAASGVALAIAAIGLLGLALFTAERRTKEIGLRKAMGACRRDILRFLGWQFARPLLWANLIAWPCAYLLMRRWLDGFAYHVNLGPLAFLLASALALIIALFTVLSHAILVSRARPVEALRYE